MWKLDLRWNNIGIIGGNSLLDLLKTNTTLSKVDLQGNHVPKEILKAIGKIVLSFQRLMDFSLESSLLHNLERNQMMTEMGVVRKDLQRKVEIVQEQVSSDLFPKFEVDKTFQSLPLLFLFILLASIPEQEHLKCFVPQSVI